VARISYRHDVVNRNGLSWLLAISLFRIAAGNFPGAEAIVQIVVPAIYLYLTVVVGHRTVWNGSRHGGQIYGRHSAASAGHLGPGGDHSPIGRNRGVCRIQGVADDGVGNARGG
jgi:hypothetical protein